MKSLVGRKMGMTEVFAQDGTMYPVTVVEVLPNVIISKKKTVTKPYKSVTKIKKKPMSTNRPLAFIKKPTSARKNISMT